MKTTVYTYETLPPVCKKSLDTNPRIVGSYDEYLYELVHYTPKEAKLSCMTKTIDLYEDFGLDFDSYHKIYIGDRHQPLHEEQYPSFESMHEGSDEWLDDGWHRFHNYIYHNYPTIPVLRLYWKGDTLTNKQN